MISFVDCYWIAFLWIATTGFCEKEIYIGTVSVKLKMLFFRK